MTSNENNEILLKQQVDVEQGFPTFLRSRTT